MEQVTESRRKPIVVGIGELLWDMLPSGKKAGGAPINFVYHASCLGAEGYAIPHKLSKRHHRDRRHGIPPPGYRLSHHRPRRPQQAHPRGAGYNRRPCLQLPPQRKAPDPHPVPLFRRLHIPQAQRQPALSRLHTLRRQWRVHGVFPLFRYPPQGTGISGLGGQAGAAGLLRSRWQHGAAARAGLSLVPLVRQEFPDLRQDKDNHLRAGSHRG